MLLCQMYLLLLAVSLLCADILLLVSVQTDDTFPKWTALGVPAVALALACMEIEAEGCYQWATRMPTRAFGKMTAYHFAFGASIVGLLQLGVSLGAREWSWERQRHFVSNCLMVFLIEDLLWHLINPPPTCEINLWDACLRDPKKGPLKTFGRSRLPAMYPILFAFALLISPEPSAWLTTAAQIVVAFLLAFVPGRWIRQAYESRRADARARVDSGVLETLQQYQEKHDLRLLMEAMYPKN
jgi:hypothetical protein